MSRQRPAPAMPAVPGPRAPGPDRSSDIADPLQAAAAALHRCLVATPLPLALEGAEALGAERTAVLQQLEDYVLPRLAHAGRPPLVVVGGPTGAGKSTLVNTLVGAGVTRPGMLRPTTRSAVLVHHPDDASWFGPDRLLPTLTRVAEVSDDPGALQLRSAASVPAGVAIMDAPDFDSVDDHNRAVATKVLAAADVWLFVTSAARYSDQLPWRHLEQALEREATVVVVMNRIPPEDRDRVAAHLTRMLDARGFPAERRFFVENGPVDADGLLPAAQVEGIRTFLESLGRDAGTQDAMVRQTLAGALRRACRAGHEVAAAAGTQVDAVGELVAAADAAYDTAAEVLRGSVGDGTLLPGRIASQWEELSGVTVAEGLPPAFAAVRRRAAGDDPPREADVRRLELALNVALDHAVSAGLEHAAEEASGAVRTSTHGDALLAWSEEDLGRPGRAVRAELPRALAAWQDRLATLVRQELLSSDLADGLDAVGLRALGLAVAVHAVSTPDLLDARSAAADRYGLRGLLVTAAEELARTIEALLEGERRRYTARATRWPLTHASCAELGRRADAVLAALDARAGR
ncbi:MAG: ABC transporter [Marmoricola sp.]